MFHNIQINLLILKTYYGQFTLATKKSLHIIFKEVFLRTSHKIGHLGEVLHNQSPSLVLKKLNPTQQKQATQD